jgi:hypothetical protein
MCISSTSIDASSWRKERGMSVVGSTAEAVAVIGNCLFCTEGTWKCMRNG